MLPARCGRSSRYARSQKLTGDEQKIAKLCDMPMDGDRGVISTFPRFEFELGHTIAQGGPCCQITIRKKQ